jgi:L-fucose mutarotase
MQVMPGDPVKTPIWDEYRATVAKYDERGADAFEEIERFAFYEKARGAYAVIATGERAIYANLILQKGVVTE